MMAVFKGTPVPSKADSEGKQHARFDIRDAGSGGNGIVLNLDMVSTSYYGVAYTVPVLVGSAQQNFSLQVDTGSSDLWIASKLCSTASCSSTYGHLYDPSSSTPSGFNFTMTYLSGSVIGSIVWDVVQLGTYNVPNQALAAADVVADEPLGTDFEGILGLALPLNSAIAQLIPSATDNSPDGASFSSNIFSMTPVSPTPFFSLTLGRPGSDEIPSLLGIGLHPSSVVPDPSKINYSTLVSSSAGALYWKTNIRAVTVYVDGVACPVTLTDSVDGAAFPTALLDSGVPLIITTSSIANGIYGALGIHPASDGQYYVPCTTPLNMTITLDSQPELPIHPLDLTSEPSGQTGAQYCVGLIQADDAQLTATSGIGDMILGVPFMRNVYTVLAYEPPPFNTSVYAGIDPTLGLLGLTNITLALEEFNNVRVLNQPLSGAPSNQITQSSGGKLSVGLEVLIGLAGFFALCFILFGLKWLIARRQWKKQGVTDLDGVHVGEDEYKSYQLTRRNSQCSEEGGPPMSTLRTLASGSYAGRKEKLSEYTVDSSRTHVELDPNAVGQFAEWGVDRDHDRSPPLSDPWDPYARNRDTIVGTDAPSPDIPVFSNFSSATASHRRTPGEVNGVQESVSVPLLTDLHRRSDSHSSDSDSGETSVGMAGIGTMARRSQQVSDLRQSQIVDVHHSLVLSDSSGRNVSFLSLPDEAVSLSSHP